MEKHKFDSISLTMRDREILSKLSTHMVSNQCTLGNFQKKKFLPKNGGHFEFSNICQKWKNTNLLVSLTKERFRRNFRPTGYLSKLLFAIFEKISSPEKMPAILNFYPTALKGCRVLFSPMVGGRAEGRTLSGLYLRNYKV